MHASGPGTLPHIDAVIVPSECLSDCWRVVQQLLRQTPSTWSFMTMYKHDNVIVIVTVTQFSCRVNHRWRHSLGGYPYTSTELSGPLYCLLSAAVPLRPPKT